MKNTNIILVVLIILLAGGFFYYNASIKEKTILNVNGEATINAVADQVSIYVVIDTLKDTAQESKDKNAEISERVLDALSSIGIKRSEIETSSYNIYPEYDWVLGSQKLKGYKTSNILKIKTTDFNKVGKIVDASVDAGATAIQSINFELSQEKQNQVKTEAISKATQDARIKAEATAQGLNAKLGKVKSVTISDYNYYPIPIYVLESGADVKQAVSTEILPTSLDVRASVSVVFEIN